MKKIAIIGLGYVGLPLLCLTIEKGYETIGFDIDKEKLSNIRNRKIPLEDEIVKHFFTKTNLPLNVTNIPEELQDTDITIICVPTPVYDDFSPNLTPIKEASKTTAKTLKKGQLIVVESTIYPGTIEEIVIPILEETGLKAGEDFYIAHCPERIDPGNQQWTLRNIPRVLGAMSKIGFEIGEKFYESILEGSIHAVSSIKAAEACKVVENSFRDINIAFVNELAISFQIMDIDILEVIKGASTKPFAFMPHYSGAGVGGHCIPVDPYYLIKKAHDLGFEHAFLKLARTINNHMPNYTVSLLELQAREMDIDLSTKIVGLMGISFKRNIDDMRNSPYFKIAKLLEERNLTYLSFDPYILEKSSTETLNDFLEKVDFLVLITNHSEFENISIKLLKEKNVLGIIDGRNILNKEEIKQAGIGYKGIGRN